jgi:hypothetical protein
MIATTMFAPAAPRWPVASAINPPQVYTPAASLPVRWSPLQLAPRSPLMRVGIPSSVLQARSCPETLGRQARSNWCWAACIQMVLNQHGLPVQQAQLVQRCFGALPDLPLTGPQILKALDGWSLDQNGRARVVSGDPVPPDNLSMVADLHAGNPLIVALRSPNGQGGHAYVLTGCDYYVDGLGQTQIQNLILRDPWPENLSRLEISAADFAARAMFATRVHVSP